jgi:hypothetical protein
MGAVLKSLPQPWFIKAGAPATATAPATAAQGTPIVAFLSLEDQHDAGALMPMLAYLRQIPPSSLVEATLEIPQSCLGALPSWHDLCDHGITRISFMDWPSRALGLLEPIVPGMGLFQSWNIDIDASDRYSPSMIGDYIALGAPHYSLYGFDDPTERHQAGEILVAHGFTDYDCWHYARTIAHRSRYLQRIANTRD